jgi:phosphoadenylyl-sulfate reductase (thioredoxin)
MQAAFMNAHVPAMASTVQRGIARQQIRHITAAKPVISRVSLIPMMAQVPKYPFSSSNKPSGFKPAQIASGPTRDIGMSMTSSKAHISTLMGANKFVNGAKPFGSMATPQADAARDLGMRGAATVMSASAGAWDQETV